MDEIFSIKFPVELSVKEKVILKFSNKQGGAFNIFSYYWQCFVWAATIGFLRNERREIASPSERIFNLNIMRNNNGEKDVQALICMCIARTGSLDIMKEPEEAIRVIAEYANGGFYHIMQLMENGENTFNDMQKVMQEVFSRELSDISFIDDFSFTEEEAIENVDSTNQSANKQFLDTTPVDESLWSSTDAERLTLFFQHGMDISRIAEKFNTSTKTIQFQLDRLGLMEMPLDITIENTVDGSYIYSRSGQCLFKDNAQLKVINGKIYRFNFKPQCLTIKVIERHNGEWKKGSKKLVAYPESELFSVLSSASKLDYVEDFIEGETMQKNRIKVKGVWYNFFGDQV